MWWERGGTDGRMIDAGLCVRRREAVLCVALLCWLSSRRARAGPSPESPAKCAVQAGRARAGPAEECGAWVKRLGEG